MHCAIDFFFAVSTFYVKVHFLHKITEISFIFLQTSARRGKGYPRNDSPVFCRPIIKHYDEVKKYKCVNR